jgi:hypothetical protein
MGKVRRCDKRCHTAKGTRCKCWCGGFFHGSSGAANRAALAQGTTRLLEEHGFKKDETAYIGQERLPMKDLPEAEAR